MQNAKLFRVAIEGGPGSGKTSLAQSLRRGIWLATGVSPRNPVQVVPEIATILFTNMDGRIPGNSEPLRAWNRAFFEMGLLFERFGEIQAVEAGKRIVVMDRSILTRLEFPGVEHAEFTEATNITVEQGRDSYDLILFMEMPDREIYEAYKHGNSARAQTYEEACTAAEIARTLHRGHRNFISIPNRDRLEQRIRLAKRHIAGLLADPSSPP